MKIGFNTPVFVTGAGGFIGSYLVEELARRGASVTALVRYSSTGSHGWLEELNQDLRPLVRVLRGDIREAPQVRRAMEGSAVVFHLAALIGIPYSYESPLAYVRVNTEGTLNVLEAARQLGVHRVVHTSTSEVYGTARTVPISEDHPQTAQSPYAASKIAADRMAESFFLSFQTPVVTARPFNTFGPRQSARAVIPTIAAQLLHGVPNLELGNLSPTRDLNYVQNTVEGLIACAEAPEEALGQVFNLGSGSEISIGELAQTLIRLTGSNAEILSVQQRHRPQGSEVERLLADSSKAHRVLGWEPRIDLEAGLRETLAWMDRNLWRYRPSEYAV